MPCLQGVSEVGEIRNKTNMPVNIENRKNSWIYFQVISAVGTVPAHQGCVKAVNISCILGHYILALSYASFIGLFVAGGRLSGTLSRNAVTCITGHEYFQEGTIMTTATNEVAGAIKAGLLTRPEHCEKCGKKPPRMSNNFNAIVAHHNDYDRPLDITWLCRHCHFLWHVTHGLMIHNNNRTASLLGHKKNCDCDTCHELNLFHAEMCKQYKRIEVLVNRRFARDTVDNAVAEHCGAPSNSTWGEFNKAHRAFIIAEES